MAIVRKTIDVCDRDAFGLERPATEERVFSLDGSYYKIQLCDQHASMFDRDFGGWARLAQEIDPPLGRQKSEFFTAERKREAARITELRERANRRAASQDFAQRRLTEIEQEEAMRAEQRARQSIPGAMNWRLTTHARERMVERGFTIEQVLRTCAQPTMVHRQPWRGPHIAIRMNGDCRVAVNEDSKAVITVIDRSSTLETAPPVETQKAMASS